MKSIELVVGPLGNQQKITIFVDKIVSIKENGGGSTILTMDENWYHTTVPYEKIKSIIAACYGAEDEED